MDPDSKAVVHLVDITDQQDVPAEQEGDPNPSSSEFEDSADGEPAAPQRREALLIYLSKYSNNPGMLHMKIIEHAVDFNRQEVLGELQTGKYDWMQ